jgi:hypothetical protein
MEACKFTDPDREVTCPAYLSEKPNDQSLINESYKSYRCSNDVVARGCDLYPFLEERERDLAKIRRLKKKLTGS